jgi:hypothetical protein
MRPERSCETGQGCSGADLSSRSSAQVDTLTGKVVAFDKRLIRLEAVLTVY